MLRALGAQARSGPRLPVRRAAEYGGGLYSTATLLDRAHFPDLEELVTVESSPDWAAELRRRHGGDPRWRLVEKPLAEMSAADAFRPGEGGDACGLAFVDCDDGTYESYTHRARLVRELRGALGSPWGPARRPLLRALVAHDTEQGLLNAAFDGLPNLRHYRPALGPWTGYAGLNEPPGEASVEWLPRPGEPLLGAGQAPPRPARPNVYVCITSRGLGVPDEVALSAVRAAEFVKRHGIADAEVGRSRGSYSAALTRNKAVADFLARPAFTHLMFVDDDVTLQEDAVALLLSANKDVASGCYATVRNPGPGLPPHLYVTVQVELEGGGRGWYPGWFDGMVRACGVGAGCLLVRRGVLEALGHPWFRWPEEYDPAAGKVNELSDDVDFVARAGALGFETWAVGRVRCGHLKQTDLAAWVGHSRDAAARPASEWLGPRRLDEQYAREGRLGPGGEVKAEGGGESGAKGAA